MNAWPRADTSVTTVIERLALQPLPVEGGFWAPASRDERGSAILFLLTPAGFSALHRLTVAEGWTWLAGAPARMLRLSDPGRTSEVELSVDSPTALVAPHVWQGTATRGAWTLVSCWCIPAYTEECFTAGERTPLVSAYPAAEAQIRALTR